jgi:DNA-binding response OmpR family regulator
MVLVVEDEALVALDLQAELQGSGYRVAGPFTSCADTMLWLRTDTPDIAVLDTLLKDGSCHEVARTLAERNVPFVIYSGYCEDKLLLPDFHHVTWVEKPVPPSVLIDTCEQLLVAAH